MNPRQQTILKIIIEEYINNAEPVGSKHLMSDLGVSSATIRNEMGELERQGYLRAPHTSAGRIPTEKAYLYYLQNFVESKPEAKSENRLRQACNTAKNDEMAIKRIAKTLVDLSGETAIIAMNPGWSYYTGVSNLFAKPDFADLELMQSLSEIVDRFDEVVDEMFQGINSGPQVLIGSQNPFGQHMSAVVAMGRFPGNNIGLIGLIGPMRMNYQRNLSLIEAAMEAFLED
ncbi:DeoR family transcriptional regulator [Patescibacteria group bacterium]